MVLTMAYTLCSTRGRAPNGLAQITIGLGLTLIYLVSVAVGILRGRPSDIGNIVPFRFLVSRWMAGRTVFATGGYTTG